MNNFDYDSTDISKPDPAGFPLFSLQFMISYDSHPGSYRFYAELNQIVQFVCGKSCDSDYHGFNTSIITIHGPTGTNSTG